MKKNYVSPELELQKAPDVITTSVTVDVNESDVETQKLFFNFG